MSTRKDFITACSPAALLAPSATLAAAPVAKPAAANEGTIAPYVMHALQEAHLTHEQVTL